MPITVNESASFQFSLATREKRNEEESAVDE
jgi:hypothetical protein